MTRYADKIQVFEASGLFDEAWYVYRYPDVLRGSLSPAEHYVRIGQYIGRKPNEQQDSKTVSRFLISHRVGGMSAKDIGDVTRAEIVHSRLFDGNWYCQQYGIDSPENGDALLDYLNRSANNPTIDPGPLFSTAYYAENNRDTADVAPLIHACTSGLSEGRHVFDPEKANDYLARVAFEKLDDISSLLDSSKEVRIYFWKEGNFFFSEIAEYISLFIQLKGFTVQFGDDASPPGSDQFNLIIVAPHEYCVHGPGRKWKSQILSRVIFLNTEQWHTTWFSLAYKYILMSRLAIDINPSSAAGLRAIGIKTAFLPLLKLEQSPFCVERGPLSSRFSDARDIRPLTFPENFSDRPYDVLFVGAANPRREAGLALMASTLSRHEVLVHCPRFNGPVRSSDLDVMSTSDIVQAARNSKILLNIHQGDSRYFEWHRLFLFGIMEGCVVLTEPCISNIYVKAKENFLECDLAQMPEKLRWLLETEDGFAELTRIRSNNERLICENPAWMHPSV